MKTMKKWQEPLFALGGFGTAFLNTVQGTYLLTRYNPAQTDIASKGAILLVAPLLLSLLLLVCKVFDGLIDIPIATVTDRMFRNKGKRYNAIIAGLIPLFIIYVLMWFAPVPKEVSILNTIWMAVSLIIYYSAYTLVAVPFLSSLSDMVSDQRSRVRVASWQAFFNTIGYCLAYTVVPLMRDIFSKNGGLQQGMVTTALVLSPMMLLMLIPVFLVLKKNSKDVKGVEAKDKKADIKEAKLTLFSSLGTTLKNKAFRNYIFTYVFAFFGLMLFLGGMDYLDRGILGLTTGWQISLMNMAAFAPVPLMLWFFNKINRKWGIKWALRVGLLCFIVAMGIFTAGWTKLVGEKIPFYMGMTAGLFGSYAIGAFFTIPYAMPSQIAAEEAAATGVNRSGMYFAVQGFMDQVAGALAGSVVLVNIINVNFGFFTEGAIFIGPIVIVACIISYILAGKMPGAVKTKASAETQVTG